MTCVSPTCLPEPEEDCLPILFLATGPYSPSSRTDHVVDPYTPGEAKDGYQPTCTSTVATSESSISDHGPAEWIASQLASLARIFRLLAREKASRASGPALSGKYSEQLTLFGPGWCSSKTAQRSGPKVDATLSGLSWREDIPGKMERLPLLLSERLISEIVGGCLLPTLTVSGNWNRKGSSVTSGDGLATKLPMLPASNYGRTLPQGTTIKGMTPDGKKRTVGTDQALKMMPTICASDYKSPYSEAGYRQQARKRSKPLRDTLPHTIGHRLTPEFAEWYMGFPLKWTAAPKEIVLKPAATPKSRSRQRRRGLS